MSSRLPPAQPPPPPTPPGTRIPAGRAEAIAREALVAFRSGWVRAAIVAAGVLGVVFLINVGLAWLETEAASRLIPVESQVPLPGITTAALLSTMLWHGVSLEAGIAIPTNGGASPFGFGFEVSVALTLMLGLALTAYLLFRGGQWAAEGNAELGWLAGVRGVQIALIYAFGVLLLAFLAGYEVSLGASGGAGGPESVTLGASKLGAFGMPFLIALLAAGTGAVSGRLQQQGRRARLILGGISGGWRAAWMATALASIGFLIVAAMNPDETRAYLELAPGGGLERALLVVGTLLIVPNVGVGIAAASMGGSINLATSTDTCALISYLKFPGGVVEMSSVGASAQLPCGEVPIELGPAPFQYLLFLLVPLAATVAGGWLAAQRAGSVRAEDGAGAGAAIAIPYAMWLWALALVARVGGSSSVFAVTSEGWVGPGLLSTVLIALAWGAAGGAIGGALAAVRAGGGDTNGPGENPGPP